MLEGATGEAKVWDAETGKMVLALKGHAQVVTSMEFSPDGFAHPHREL